MKTQATLEEDYQGFYSPKKMHNCIKPVLMLEVRKKDS
jgi:hypothetical protein